MVAVVSRRFTPVGFRSGFGARAAAFALVAYALAACGSPQFKTDATPPPDAHPGPPPAASVASAPALDAGAATPLPEGSASAAPSSVKQPPPKRIAARHVLIQYMGSERATASVVRTKEQARVVAVEVERRAKAGEDLARLAVEFSDEPNAGPRGGSLGRFGRGSMVQSFEDAAFALKVGEISGVVESSFGFHVIQRTE